jgi:hypothetical protein
MKTEFSIADGIQLRVKSITMITHKIKNLFFPGKWEIVLTRHNPLDEDIFSHSTSDIVLTPPFWAYWADPFIITAAGRTFVFFEEYLLKSSKGRICVIEIYAEGNASLAKTIIEEPFHLSFPNIFLYKDKYYIVPESSEANCIRLYEAVNFPYQWKYHGNILDNINAVDSIFLEQNGLWFLLTSQPSGDGCDNRGSISAYFAEEPITLGKWQPHPSNPIISNCESGRNGGSILRHNGKTLRPSQNSLKTYGESLSIMDIHEISKENYRESLHKTIKPNNINVTNIHTINKEFELWCYDRVRINLTSIVSITLYRLLSIKNNFKKIITGLVNREVQ